MQLKTALRIIYNHIAENVSMSNSGPELALHNKIKELIEKSPLIEFSLETAISAFKIMPSTISPPKPEIELREYLHSFADRIIEATKKEPGQSPNSASYQAFRHLLSFMAIYATILVSEKLTEIPEEIMPKKIELTIKRFMAFMPSNN